MNDLTNLLKRLAELDPAICEVTEHTLFLPTAGYGCGLGLFDEETQDRLQGVIQRAIVARGWSFAINPIHWRAGSFYEAVIFTPGKDGWHESENITAALLSAYVKALEA